MKSIKSRLNTNKRLFLMLFLLTVIWDRGYTVLKGYEMKNRRLLTLLIIFICISILVVLCSSVFLVKEITITGESLDDTGITEENLIDSLGIKSTSNIFLVKRSKCLENLEKNFPYIKVNKIDKKLPDGIIVDISIRKEMYLVKIQDGLYAYLDGEGRVLKVCEANPIGSTIYPCLVYFSGMSIDRENFLEGTDADIPLLYLLQNLATVLRKEGCSVEDSYNLLKQVTVISGYSTHLEIETNYGLTLEIRKVDADLCEKLEYAFEVYKNFRSETKVGKIAIFRNLEGEITHTFTSL